MLFTLLIAFAALFVTFALTASCLYWIGSVLPSAATATPATVVVLGGGVRSGRLTPLGRARVQAGVRAAGADRNILFTGGLSDSRAEAEVMAPFAVELGLLPDRIKTEGHSRTTLQNALFTFDALGGGPIILASDRFHLARAAILFRWAGFQIVGFAPSAHRSEPVAHLWQIMREALSLWLNLARMLLWHGAALIGASRAQRIKWLT
ncbi:YdcF family protein [Pontivivens insulae]|uniref:DUF218 domain-containing protein n=1 Tax=Pontivivens insulae TaxID=1639689 RepID=A0A2R8AC84_9RHOB|nr:YdcF family protein [Pontivivens insulae]RED13809.1 uncharacterized SAM-binding protein YcdF (DUF218 family) [Pontivivens insulae]SPF29883.1 hypothetical protein POI8812_02207 [Pontivivens insulae]